MLTCLYREYIEAAYLNNATTMEIVNKKYFTEFGMRGQKIRKFKAKKEADMIMG